MSEDFLDFIRLLNKHHVKFILVGGYAYAFNVQPRATEDIDFWVYPSKENLILLGAAAYEFIGFQFEPDEVMGLLNTSRLGFRLAGIKPYLIEILLRINGVDTDRAFKNARQATWKDVTFGVIHPFDQIRNKRASNRDKDQADIKNLVKLYGEPPKEF
jgi:hypothetical protein